MSEMPKTAMKAVRAKCVDCSGGNTAEVRRCQVFDCPLWSYRMGAKPETLAKKRPELLDHDAVREMADE